MNEQRKILVCDDDPGVAGVLTVILKEEGFLINILSHGKGIQKRIQEFKPDLILLDVMMPGIDGKEITKILKRERETAKIPIIIFSALQNCAQIAKDIGADDFLPKPFDISDLVLKIKKYLD